jgi:hypothetical protein
MVLGRGRGYDEIGQMLSIDRAGVRDRALAALDALGPETRVSELRRHLITDYLLGQLPQGLADQTREQLGRSPTERAWARVVASELAPIATGQLPEIPSGPVEPAEAEPAAAEEDAGPEEAPVAAPPEAEPLAAKSEEPALQEPVAAKAAAAPGAPAPRRVSRLGGAILLGVGAAIVLAVVLILVFTGSSSKRNVAATATTPTSTQSTTAGAKTATPVAQINLLSPTGSKSTAGIAEVLKQGKNTAIAIVGQGLPANSKHNAYAVWLYNAPSDAVRLGFVNPGVGKNGRLETTGPLPTNAARFKQLLLSLETNANPKQPGQVVLQGNLTGV